MVNCDTTVPHEMAYPSYPRVSAFPAFKEFEQGSTLSSQLFGLLSQCYLGSFQHSTECPVRTVTFLGVILRQIVPLRAPALRKATSPAMPAGKANGPGAKGNTPAHTAPGLMQVCDLLEKSTKRTRSPEVNNATNLWRQKLTRAVAVTTGSDLRPEIVRLKKPSKMADAVLLLTRRAWAPWSLTWLTASLRPMSSRLVMLRLRRLVKNGTVPPVLTQTVTKILRSIADRKANIHRARTQIQTRKMSRRQRGVAEDATAMMRAHQLGAGADRWLHANMAEPMSTAKEIAPRTNRIHLQRSINSQLATVG